jgi:hypothetical protein
MNTTCCAGRCSERKIFSTVLSAWLKWSNVHRKWIADELDVSVSTISHWCQGRRRARLPKLRKLTDITGICLCCFLCETAARATLATRKGWINPLRRR